MRTTGCRIIHFHGRYFRYHDQWDDSPVDYDSDIVSEIPIDPEGHQRWLAKQRAKASEWASAVEKFLHVKRPIAKETEEQDFNDRLSETASEASEEVLRHWTQYVYGHVEDLPLPSYMPVFNNRNVEWVFVIDLDREIFSVDNGAHFQLEIIPRCGWIDALDKTYYEHRLALPDRVPDNAVTSLVVTPAPPDVQLVRLYEELDIEIVTSDGINGFHPARRHEPLFCARIFQIFQRTQERVLAHLLLGWKPDDFAFREITFTIVCLASGRQNVSLVEDWRFADDNAHGCANLTNSTDPEEEPEFVAHMGVGACLNDNPAGSAPQSSMYWFEGVLIYLVARLDKPDVIPQSVARVAQRAREDFPWQPVDAVLISIAHVVLVRVFPYGKVQHTKPLPLFNLGDQPSQHPRERFSPSKLEERLQRKERATAKRAARDARRARRRDDPDAAENGGSDSSEWDFECEEDGTGSISSDLDYVIDLKKIYLDIAETEPSFFALALLFDTSKRASRTLPATARGYLPIEIYRLIINNIDDVETHGACMAVSSQFRDLCLPRNPSVIDGFTLSSNEATRAYTCAEEVWSEEKPRCHRPEHIRRWRMLRPTEPSLIPGIRVVQPTTGTERDVTIDRVIQANDLSQIRQTAAYGKSWRVVVGRCRDRRSLLLDMNLALRNLERQMD